jgi:hypothetical protein
MRVSFKKRGHKTFDSEDEDDNSSSDEQDEEKILIQNKCKF